MLKLLPFWPFSLIAALFLPKGDTVEEVTFGIMDSDRWGKSVIYRVNHNQLSFDDSEAFWRDRFSERGYIFNGTPASTDCYNFAKPLLQQIPESLLRERLPPINTTGNKMERVYYISIHGRGINLTGQIDTYDNRDSVLALKYKDFIDLLDKIRNDLDRCNKF